MDPTRITREWLEALDPAEFLEIERAVSDVRRRRQEERQRKLKKRRAGARENTHAGRYLRLERVRCGKKCCKKCCKKCSGENPELHGPYWYLYRPKKTDSGRTSKYVGKTLPEELAEEFGIPEDERTAG
jgi:hypothetical protein